MMNIGIYIHHLVGIISDHRHCGLFARWSVASGQRPDLHLRRRPRKYTFVPDDAFVANHW